MSTPSVRLDARIINLRRRPDRRRLQEPVVRYLRERGYDAQFLEAIDGANITNAQKSYFESHTVRKMSKYEIACCLSHASAWQSLPSTTTHRVVVEDDAQFLRDDWMAILEGVVRRQPNFDILICHGYAGVPDANALFYNTIGDDVWPYFNRSVVDVPLSDDLSFAGPRLGTVCYIISAKGAARFAALPFRTIVDVDIYMPHKFDRRNCLVLRNPIAIPRDIRDSDTACG